MIRQPDSTMIRELSADELLVVSGAQRAQELKEPTQVDIMGWRFQQSNNTGAVAWYGVKVPGQSRTLIYGSD
jgi:hypothetical protein